MPGWRSTRLSESLARLSDQLAGEDRQSAFPSSQFRMVRGTVVSVESKSLCTVSLGGDDALLEATPWIAPYNPQVGDVVLVLEQGTFRIIAGIESVRTPITGGGTPPGENNNGRRYRDSQTLAPAGSDLVSASYAAWPTGNSVSVDVPMWATRCLVIATIGQAYCVTQTLDHSVRIELGSLTGTVHTYVWLQAVFGTESGVESGSREDLVLMDKFDCTSQQGTSVQLRTAGIRNSGTGALRTGNSQVLSLDWEFLEVGS